MVLKRIALTLAGLFLLSNGYHNSKVRSIPPLEEVRPDFLSKVEESKLENLINDLGISPSSDMGFDYSKVKEDILVQKSIFLEAYNNASPGERSIILDDAKDYLSESFLGNIMPFWIGTKYDYNGSTNVPNKGHIACGWFVQRVYEGLGFDLEKNCSRKKLNGVRLPEFAQQWPKTSIEGLDKDGFSIISLEYNTEVLSNLENDIYLVGFCGKKEGLGNHIGFLLKTDDEIYVIHSNPTGKVGVERKKESYYLNSSEMLYLNKAFNDKVVLDWVIGSDLRWIP